ncbi:MAG: hypothetical protein KKD44_27745 [Proteobacteria bacterium]|nr:hypothetical protein [Pseudomonadota bacterium]
MEKLLDIAKQRRVWAGIVGILAFVFTTLKLNFDIDVAVLTDLLTAFGGALASLVTAGLALWSYFKPKK